MRHVAQPATAIRHYHDEEQQPRRKSQHARILEFFKRPGQGPATLKEIAVALELPDSTISGRLNEMRPTVLNVVGERKCRVNGIQKQTWWFAKPQGDLFP